MIDDIALRLSDLCSWLIAHCYALSHTPKNTEKIMKNAEFALKRQKQFTFFRKKRKTFCVIEKMYVSLVRIVNSK
ncbi:MAG: hypothetical protein J6R79_05370 [Bacteroidaceae bacterium]|nr:hypothetical protein [Bacteroidaceae bacterium]